MGRQWPRGSSTRASTHQRGSLWEPLLGWQLMRAGPGRIGRSISATIALEPVVRLPREPSQSMYHQPSGWVKRTFTPFGPASPTPRVTVAPS